MNKQLKCECTRIMCLAFFMKIINEAQNKHEYHFYQNMKNKLLGICMIYPILTICIHIPNIKRVCDVIYMKGKRLKRHTRIFIRFEYKLHIHEVKT